jgi:hypothetical protein
MLTGILQTLEAITNHARILKEVRKQDLRSGDRVMVSTKNSLYTLWTLGDRDFLVWGGWSDRQGTSPQRVSINGCTWGGSAINWTLLLRSASGLSLVVEYSPLQLDTSVLFVPLTHNQR